MALCILPRAFDNIGPYSSPSLALTPSQMEVIGSGASPPDGTAASVGSLKLRIGTCAPGEDYTGLPNTIAVVNEGMRPKKCSTSHP